MITGESAVGYFRFASSGMYFAAGSSSCSLPASRSLRIDIAVKPFVIDAMRNLVSSVTGAFVATSRIPAVFTYASLPSMMMPRTAPGACDFSNAAANV